MRLRGWLALLGAMAITLPASAGKQDLKAGLWQVSNTMTSADGSTQAAQAEMMEQLAALPPDQRKMAEAMMAQRGVKLGDGGSVETTGRICLTQEMVEQNELPVQQGDCKTTLQSRTGNSVKMSFECTNPPASGEGEYTIVSPETYTMEMTARAAVQGQTQSMNMSGKGEWLGADCGAVKPATWAPDQK